MASPSVIRLFFCLSTSGYLFQNQKSIDLQSQKLPFFPKFSHKKYSNIARLSANLKIQAFQRLPLLPVAPSEGGVLFPECKAIVQVSGEDELSSLRSIEGERLPLFGYCTVDESGEMFSVGTMALLENVHWASVVSEEEEGDVMDLDEQIAICSCIGVQRFKILEVEQLKPFPVARVQLFADELVKEEEAKLETVEKLAMETAQEVIRLESKLTSDNDEEGHRRVEEATSKILRFTPGGPGTEQKVMGPLGPMGFKLGERERREFLSFALADLQNVPVVVRYDILKCRSTISRFKRVAEMMRPALNELAAKASLKDLKEAPDT
mmetsp:Transcript_44029/g.138954  ORF Transcript_44029/g.138954 Transcript_44029/m.138954 type:complete len:323 (-) Transcript_44029:117-1085(-)